MGETLLCTADESSPLLGEVERIRVGCGEVEQSCGAETCEEVKLRVVFELAVQHIDEKDWVGLTDRDEGGGQTGYAEQQALGPASHSYYQV